MRMPGEREEKTGGIPLIYKVAGMSLFILIVLAVVITNSENSGSRKSSNGSNNSGMSFGNNAETPEPVSTPEAEVSEMREGFTTENAYIEKLYKEHKLRVDDLDFWNMYPQEEGNFSSGQNVEPEKPVETPTPTPKEVDPSEDGKHTLVTRTDGTSDWVQINPYITKNEYDPMKLILKKDRMGYYEGQKLTSFFGIDISKYNGKVDFAKLKEDNVDFVMIRLGARGYGSGQILLDENFEANIMGANEAGIDVGVYFFSQAITVEEAAEEAAFVVQNLVNRKVAYPIVFDMEYINNDTARIDSLKKDAKTAIANTFLTNIQTAGYTPMLYGTKEWLIEQIDLTQLMGYDIWLSQQSDLPDYPYKYQMWQYSLKGGVAGIEGDVDMNISFVDYGAKY